MCDGYKYIDFTKQNCNSNECIPTKVGMVFLLFILLYGLKSSYQLECIHGILTPRASPSRMGVRVASLIVTTMCNFERGGATKPTIRSAEITE